MVLDMPSLMCVMLAFLLFFLGATARWWPVPAERPFYPALISAGLAFLVFGVWLLPTWLHGH